MNNYVSGLMFFTMTMNKIFQFLATITICCCFVQSAEIGDRCEIPLTKTLGICKKHVDCPLAQQQAQNGIPITTCGYYDLTEPIVCCETNDFIEPNDGTLLSLSNKPDTDFVFPSNYPDEPTAVQDAALTKSEEKCQEYNKLASDVIHAITLVANPSQISINIEKCDYSGVSLIVGGKEAEAGEFPFMAAIGFLIEDKIEFKCGGTLISEQFVVTAAHCTFSREGAAPKIVRLGDLDLKSKDDGSIHADYNIRNVIVHPNYRYPYKYNDIALIKLTNQVKFTKYIRPACLYNKEELEYSQAIATGWGKIDYVSTEMNDKLLKVSLNIYDNRYCAKTYAGEKNLPRGITDNMLCAGVLEGGKDTCQGDSGGPLLVTKKENHCKFQLVGITSFGKSCGLENILAVYTKVSDFVPWIERTIW